MALKWTFGSVITDKNGLLPGGRVTLYDEENLYDTPEQAYEALKERDFRLDETEYFLFFLRWVEVPDKPSKRMREPAYKIQIQMKLSDNHIPEWVDSIDYNQVYNEFEADAILDFANRNTNIAWYRKVLA